MTAIVKEFNVKNTKIKCWICGVDFLLIENCKLPLETIEDIDDSVISCKCCANKNLDKNGLYVDREHPKWNKVKIIKYKGQASLISGLAGLSFFVGDIRKIFVVSDKQINRMYPYNWIAYPDDSIALSVKEYKLRYHEQYKGSDFVVYGPKGRVFVIAVSRYQNYWLRGYRQ